MCETPNIAANLFPVIYFAYAFIQAIITVRIMDEKSAPGLMIFLCIVAAPLVSGLLFMAGCSRFTKFLLNVGRKPDNRIIP